MTYNFICCNDNFKSLMWGVIADSRVNIPAIKDQFGSAIKSYVDSQTALVTPGVIIYKIEGDGGVLAGFFGLQTSQNPVFVLFSQYRPAFVADSLAIGQQISKFVQNGDYQFDTLN